MSLTKEFEEKKKKQAEFSSKLKDPKARYASSDFDFKQHGKLVDLEKNFIF